MFNLNWYSYLEDLNLGLVKYSPKKKKILDVGCGYGVLGEVYKKKGNIVYGIDREPDVTYSATKRLDRFYKTDVLAFRKISKLLCKEKFDVIVFADVIEHLYDPIAIIHFYKKYLKSGGYFYISVPNFVIWYTRLQILFGNYLYTDTGTQDKTHIRIFTLNNIKRFAKITQLRIEHIDITPGIVRFFVPYARKIINKKDHDPKALIKSKYYRFYTRYIYNIEYLFCKLLPGLLAYQYIVILKKER